MKKNVKLENFVLPAYKITKPCPLENIMHYLNLHADEIDDYDLKANNDGIDLKITLKKRKKQND